MISPLFVFVALFSVCVANERLARTASTRSLYVAHHPRTERQRMLGSPAWAPFKANQGPRHTFTNRLQDLCLPDSN
jgi:hypothetical protein